MTTNKYISLKNIFVQFLLFLLIAGSVSSCNLINTENDHVEMATLPLPDVEETDTKSPGQIWLDKIETIRSKDWQRRYHQNIYISYSVQFGEPVLVENDVVKGEFEIITVSSVGETKTKHSYETISENQVKRTSVFVTDNQGKTTDRTDTYNTNGIQPVIKLDLFDNGNMLVIDRRGSTEIFVAR